MASLLTAREIANELGLTISGVHKRLKNAAGQKCLVNGQHTLAWLVSELPTDWKSKLEQSAKRTGYRSAEHYLSDSGRRWEPDIPLARLERKWVEQAIKLCEAQRLPLERRHEMSQADLVTLGRKEYSRVCGHEISAENWQKLFDRTLHRDRSAENWTRVELYLDDAAFIRPVIDREALRQRHLHIPLKEHIKGMENRSAPTPEDREFLFHAAFVHYEALTSEESDAGEQRAILNSLVAFLSSAVPALAKSSKALRKQFERGLRKWRNGGRAHTALQDRRRLNSGNFRTPDFSTDNEKIRDLAIVHGRSESLAHRLLRKRGEC